MEQIKCPKCGKSHYTEGMRISTAIYQPTEIKNGEVVDSEDPNVHTIECECCECGERFVIETHHGKSIVRDLGPDRPSVIATTDSFCKNGSITVSASLPYLNKSSIDLDHLKADGEVSFVLDNKEHVYENLDALKNALRNSDLMK